MDEERRQSSGSGHAGLEACDERDADGGEVPATVGEHEVGVPARLGIWCVSAYREYVSPALPPSCRYRPTCSEYTLTAIKKYGLLKGGWLGIKRICRCHPFHSGGHDPVP